MKTINILLGISPNVKILVFLFDNKNKDFTMTEIVRGSRSGRHQAYQIIKGLLKEGVVLETRKVGLSKFYQLNDKDIVVKNISRLFRCIED